MYNGWGNKYFAYEADDRVAKEIAKLLVISPETAKRHVANVCRKLQVRSRRAAVARGRMLGLVP